MLEGNNKNIDNPNFLSLSLNRLQQIRGAWNDNHAHEISAPNSIRIVRYCDFNLEHFGPLICPSLSSDRAGQPAQLRYRARSNFAKRQEKLKNTGTKRSPPRTWLRERNEQREARKVEERRRWRKHGRNKRGGRKREEKKWRGREGEISHFSCYARTRVCGRARGRGEKEVTRERENSSRDENYFRREGARGRERKRQKDGEEIFLATEISVTREGSPRERERERER